MNAYETVDEYVAALSVEERTIFETVWQAMLALVPDGEEAMRYGLPTIRFRGKNLVHLGVMKEHLGFYPGASGVAAFESVINGKYDSSKGTIRFPLDERPPLALIQKIVKFRLAEERAKKSL